MPTEEEKVTRKLRAILSADVKGYSLLMTNDEAFTVKTLKEYRAVMSNLIGQHTGRVVDDPGDNLLAEFASVVDAIRCAVEIQKVLKEYNEKLPAEKQLEFRIGVNIGDVIQDQDRLYGEGVNIAARIEGLAEPGGVCISRNAYDHIRNKMNLGYKYLGEHSVKNIKTPVRVYKLLMADEDAGKLIGEAPNPFANKWIWATAVLVVIVIASVVSQVYQKIAEPEFEPANVEEMAYPLPDNPSIAVLPFDNLSGNPEDEPIADGLSESIITALSKTPKMFVIARNSTFTYKGKATKVQQIAEELGVRYVLEGSLQKSNDQLRINAQLIDAISGNHIWAEKYDRDMADFFELQDDIAMKIITALNVELTQGERGQFFAAGTKNIDAYLMVLHGLQLSQSFNKERISKAIKVANKAVSIDPNYPAAYYLLSRSIWKGISIGAIPPSKLESGIESINKAISLDESYAEALAYLGWIYTVKRQHEEGIAIAERAYSMSPNSAEVCEEYGLTLIYGGRCDDAIIVLENGLRRSPMPTADYNLVLGIAYRCSGRYEEAINFSKRATYLEPNTLWAHNTLAIAYAMLGKEDESKASAVEIMRIKPDYSIQFFKKMAYYADPEITKLHMEALRTAGIPEYSPGKEPPDKPAIAVLPFDNMTGDPDQNYFCDGFTEHIISTLSYVPELLVISRRSTFAYKDKSLNVQQIGAELAANWIIEGSIQKSDKRIRITVQLIEVNTGHHRWSETYDRELNDIFKLQDDIAFRILKEMQIKLTSGEGLRNVYDGINSVDEYKKVLKIGEIVHNDYTLEGLKRAEQEILDLIAMNPNIPVAHTSLAEIYLQYIWQDNCASFKACIGKASESAKKAIKINENFDSAYVALGRLSMMTREFEKAKTAVEKARLINPSNSEAYNIFGEILMCQSQFNEAIIQIEKAIRLDPLPNWYYYLNLGQIYQYMKSFTKAIEYYNKSIEVYPNHWGNYAGLVVSYSMLGDMDKANIAKSKLLSFIPDFTISLILKASPLENQEAREIMREGFRKAGIPE